MLRTCILASVLLAAPAAANDGFMLLAAGGHGVCALAKLSDGSYTAATLGEVEQSGLTDWTLQLDLNRRESVHGAKPEPGENGCTGAPYLTLGFAGDDHPLGMAYGGTVPSAPEVAFDHSYNDLHETRKAMLGFGVPPGMPFAVTRTLAVNLDGDPAIEHLVEVFWVGRTTANIDTDSGYNLLVLIDPWEEPQVIRGEVYASLGGEQLLFLSALEVLAVADLDADGLQEIMVKDGYLGAVVLGRDAATGYSERLTCYHDSAC